jgi:hypothetical protein
MNPIAGIISLTLSILIVLGWLLLFFHRWSYAKGARGEFDRGYKKGRKDEGDWWIAAEEQAYAAREQIWREEASA